MANYIEKECWLLQNQCTSKILFRLKWIFIKYCRDCTTATASSQSTLSLFLVAVVVVVSITFCGCEKMRFRLPADSSDRNEAAAATGTWLSCVAYVLVHFDLENVCCCCTTTCNAYLFQAAWQRDHDLWWSDAFHLFFSPKMFAIHFECYWWVGFSRSCNHHLMSSWSRRNGWKCKYSC